MGDGGAAAAATPQQLQPVGVLEFEALRKENQVLRKEIRLLGERVLSELEADEQRRSTELDILHQRLQGLDLRLDKILGADVSRFTHGASAHTGGDGDPHQKAKLLLSNGVPEERVIDETGLSVEDVSLLRSLMERHAG